MTSKTYGIVGQGRLAGHMIHLLRLKQLHVVQWHRRMTRPLEQVLAEADVILILINDDEIESFIRKNPWLKNKILIHCSGSLVTKLAQGFHPHFNFTMQLYKEEVYNQIPFVIEKGKYSFQDIFPDFSNPSFVISKANKPLYHALSVMCGNFPSLIWRASSKIYARKMKLPPTFFGPYLGNVVNQFLENPSGALTGPLVRGDKKTIEKNLKALKRTPLYEIYKVFQKQYPKLK